MKIYNQVLNKLKDQRGAVAVIVAILAFFVLIGMMALAIDVGYLYATKNELQDVADASAVGICVCHSVKFAA
jgi:Flp pilus assembly protein TadG